MLTDIDQARVDKGVGYVHGELDKLAARGRLSNDAAQPAQGPGQRVAVQGRLRRRRPGHRGRLRGDVGQAAGVRRGGGGRLAGVRAGDQHLGAVGDRDGRRSWSTPSGSSGCTSSTRSPSCRCWRWCARERTDDATLATAFAVGKALKKSCVLVADAPAFVVNRLLTRFLGEITAAVEQGTPVAVADRALDPLGLPMTPVRAAARWSARRWRCTWPSGCTRRSPTGSPSARGCGGWSSSGKSSVYSEPGVVDPDLAGIDAGDSPLTEDAGAVSAPSRRWPRRSG